MKSGDLRNLVTIQALPTPLRRGRSGEELRDDSQWSAIASAPAKIDTQGGREFYAAKSVNASLSHEITIRYRGVPISAGMRVLYQDPKLSGANRYFAIHAALNSDNEIPYGLVLHCEELIGRTPTA